MDLEAAWNGVIVSQSQLNQEDEFLLKSRGIERVKPVWASLFQEIRNEKKPSAGEPYAPHFSLIYSCPCFKFMEELFGRIGLRVMITDSAMTQCGLVVTEHELQEGDLLYFRDKRARYFGMSFVHHVAIVTDPGTAIHPTWGEELWEGAMGNLLANGAYVIGRRLIGTDPLATYAVPEGGRDDFSLRNAEYLRSFIASR